MCRHKDSQGRKQAENGSSSRESYGEGGSEEGVLHGSKRHANRFLGG